MTGRFQTVRRTHARQAWLAAALTALAACSSSPGTTSPPPGQPPQALWGELKPVVSVKELMKYMIDPVADNVFNAVGSTLTRDGTTEWEPKTDEDWEKIRVGAVSLAEAADLLRVPRPFAPAGDLNNSTGPNPVELSPAAITAKVERDPVEWNARIQALRNAALSIMEIVDRRDVQGVWDAGEFLDQSCEACHRSYWYPGENAQFYRRLRNRLDEHTRAGNGPAANNAPNKQERP
jgi:cytochrome c556